MALALTVAGCFSKSIKLFRYRRGGSTDMKCSIDQHVVGDMLEAWLLLMVMSFLWVFGRYETYNGTQTLYFLLEPCLGGARFRPCVWRDEKGWSIDVKRHVRHVTLCPPQESCIPPMSGRACMALRSTAGLPEVFFGLKAECQSEAV